jgi:hypothetical protein
MHIQTTVRGVKYGILTLEKHKALHLSAEIAETLKKSSKSS